MPATSRAPAVNADKAKEKIILRPAPAGSRLLVDCTIASYLKKTSTYEAGVGAVCAQPNIVGGEARDRAEMGPDRQTSFSP